MKKKVMLTFVCIVSLLLCGAFPILASASSGSASAGTAAGTAGETALTVTKVKKGLVYENNQYRYYTNGKLLKNKWKVINGKRYYFTKNGNAAKGGAVRINKVYYVFNEKAQLLTPKKTSFVTVGKNKYYINKKGKPVSGWLLQNKKLYYIGKNGKMAVSKTIDGITLNKYGYVKYTVKIQCTIEARKFIERHTSSGMSKLQKLRACYNYILWYQTFRANRDPDFSSKNWPYACAVDMFTSSNLAGNCYGFACTVAAVAKELGFQPYVLTVPDDHGYVRIDGAYYDNMGALFGASSPYITSTPNRIVKF
jgi:hypothetical protein